MIDQGFARSAVVVCDLDDTLYLERDYVLSGFKSLDLHVSEKFGISDFSAAAWALFLEGHRNDIFNRVLGSRGCEFNEADILEMVRLYRHHVPQITLIPDVVQFLGHVADSVALALVTDGPVAAQSAKIRALGLESHFAPIHITDRWGVSFRKPHPLCFRSIMATYKYVKASNFVYIADNPIKDFLAPGKLGWWTVRIRRDGALHAKLEGGSHSKASRSIFSFACLQIDCLEQGQCP